jgi:hypothetical protein
LCVLFPFPTMRIPSSQYTTSTANSLVAVPTHQPDAV